MSSDGTTRLIFTLQADQQTLVASFGQYLPIQINSTLQNVLNDINDAQTSVQSAINASSAAVSASGQALNSANNAQASAAQALTYSNTATTQASNASASATAAATSAVQAAKSATDAANALIIATNTASSNSPNFSGTVSIGGYTKMVEIDGDSYSSYNAYYDGTNWQRVNPDEVAWLFQVNMKNNMFGESYKALTTWVCAPGPNPVGPTTSVGGWTMVQSYSQFHDVTLGGNGFEIDGNGTVPYARLQHATVGATKRTGILTNVFIDESGRDDPTQNSWWFGVNETGTPGADGFKLQLAPAGGTTFTWSDLLNVSSTGHLKTADVIESAVGFVFPDGSQQNTASNKSTAANIVSNAAEGVVDVNEMWSASQWTPLGASLSGTVTVDASTGFRFYGTITGNVTINFANLKNGQPVEICLYQDSVGGHTVSWQSGVKWINAAPTIGTAASANAVMASIEGTWQAGVYFGSGATLTS